MIELSTLDYRLTKYSPTALNVNIPSYKDIFCPMNCFIYGAVLLTRELYMLVWFSVGLVADISETKLLLSSPDKLG